MLYTLCVLSVFGVACKLLNWNHVSFSDGQCPGTGCSFEQRGLAGAKEVGAFTFPPSYGAPAQFRQIIKILNIEKSLMERRW